MAEADARCIDSAVSALNPTAPVTSSAFAGIEATHGCSGAYIRASMRNLSFWLALCAAVPEALKSAEGEERAGSLPPV